MAISLTVTSQKLRDTAAQLRSLNARLRGELSNMSSRESSLNGMWDGQANDTFHNAYVHDVREYNDFIQAIEEYIRALLQAADEYERTENRNQQIASNRSYH